MLISSLGLSFLTCEMEMLVPTSQSFVHKALYKPSAQNNTSGHLLLATQPAENLRVTCFTGLGKRKFANTQIQEMLFGNQLKMVGL